MSTSASVTSLETDPKNKGPNFLSKKYVPNIPYVIKETFVLLCKEPEGPRSKIQSETQIKEHALEVCMYSDIQNSCNLKVV